MAVLYLVYEDGAAQASPPRLAGSVEGAVLGNDHHVDGDAAVAGLLGGQAEVEAVAGVVLDNEKDPGGSCEGEGSCFTSRGSHSGQSVSKSYTHSLISTQAGTTDEDKPPGVHYLQRAG